VRSAFWPSPFHPLHFLVVLADVGVHASNVAVSRGNSSRVLSPRSLLRGFHLQTVAQQRESRPYLSFDKFQFSRRPKMASVNSELSYGDIRGIHLLSKGSSRYRGYIGRWATNPPQLQKVILTRGWHFLHGGRSTIPPEMTWPMLKKLCDEKFATRSTEWMNADSRKDHLVRFIRSVNAAGGYLEYIAALAYRSLVLGHESSVIGQQMEITSVNVRTQIFRLNQIAERLGFESHRPHHSRGRWTPIDASRHPIPLPENFRAGERLIWSPEFILWLGRMREQGFKWTDIAATLGVPDILEKYYRKVKSNPLHRQKRPKRVKPPREPKPPRTYLLWTPKLVCEICDLRERGRTWREIGLKFGRSAPTMLLGFRRVTTGSETKTERPGC
jgi:hypothetical protein